MRAVRNTNDGIQVLAVARADGADLSDPVVPTRISVGICGSDPHIVGLGLHIT